MCGRQHAPRPSSVMVKCYGLWYARTLHGLGINVIYTIFFLASTVYCMLVGVGQTVVYFIIIIIIFFFFFLNKK